MIRYTDQGGDLLVNEIGRYAGQTTPPDRAFLLAVTRDGAWTITPS